MRKSKALCAVYSCEVLVRRILEKQEWTGNGKREWEQPLMENA